MAARAGLPMVYLPLEAVTSKWYGEGEKRLAQVRMRTLRDERDRHTEGWRKGAGRCGRTRECVRTQARERERERLASRTQTRERERERERDASEEDKQERSERDARALTRLG
eukprot:1290031-Rhodomonas_salina.2